MASAPPGEGMTTTELYNRVLRFMDQAGVKPAAISAAAPRPASPHAGPGAVTALHSSQPPLTQGYGFAQPPMMDAATLVVPADAIVDSGLRKTVFVDRGGGYFEAGNSDELRSAYADIGSSVGFETETQDVSARFIGIGLAFAVLAALASMFWFARLP